MKERYYLWLAKLMSNIHAWALRRAGYYTYKACGARREVDFLLDLGKSRKR